MLMESFHSGQRGQRRYCSLHRPSTRLVRSTGVVLCNPLGHEYYRTHRSYVKLADRLARLGFPVMRFDYSGSGDAEGEAGRDGIDACLDEVMETVADLHSKTSVSDIAFGGARFGALLAMLAANRGAPARALMLWDPLIDGKRYIDDLAQLHERMLSDLERFARPRRARDCREGEFVGTRYPAQLLRDLAAMSSSTMDNCNAGQITLVRSAGGQRVDALASSLARRTPVHVMENDRDYGWQDVYRIGETIMDPEAVAQMATSMNAAAA